MRQIEAEEQLRQLKQKEQQGKIKTFSQIVEKRSSKRSYNLDLYIGQGDDSGVGGTPEPDEQEAGLDSQHLSLRSDTSEGMTSETDSIDSDVHGSEKMIKEPPKVPKKPHSWLVRKDSTDSIPSRTAATNVHMLSSGENISENISSTEPSDAECHAADNETVSSEDDAGFCQPVRQVDSGLDSLCDSHRPNDTADSASDLSQDSCSGIDKSTPDIEPDAVSSDEVEEQPCRRSKKRPLMKSVSIRDDLLEEEEDGNILIKITAKQNHDAKGFGFTLKGGKDQGIHAYIDFVSPGSPADFAGLKKGDKVLSLNGEPTADYSHSSLVFSIKQATYSGEIDMVISHPPETDVMLNNTSKKSAKCGSSFAEKIALFSGGVTSENNRSSHMLKSIESDEEAQKSLVLKRRSAFEKSATEPNLIRQSSCTSPENTIYNIEEQRHSICFTSYQDKSPDSTIKKPPPPVPVKPKLRTKPRLVSQSSINEPDPPEIISTKKSDETFEHLNFYASSEEFDSNNHDSEIRVEESFSKSESLECNQQFDCLEAKSISEIGEVVSIEPLETLHNQSIDNSSDKAIADYSSCNSDSLSPKVVDSDVNNVGGIAEDVESLSLCDKPEYSHYFSAVEPSTAADDGDVSEELETSNDLLEKCNHTLEENAPEQDWYTNEDATTCENECNPSSEIPEDDEQLIIDSDISSLSREEFVQINMHPLGLPLEKIDEDDGCVSASTTPSSDTPDTETIIDNLPTNISPLPNDDVIEEKLVPDESNIPTSAATTDSLLLRNHNSESDESAVELQRGTETSELEQYSDPIRVESYTSKSNFLQYEDDQQQYELEESSDQLSPLDVIDQIEMKLMQQLEQDALEDLAESTNKPLDDGIVETVHRQLLYLSEDADLLDDLDAPRNVVPPSEPPPPPPPEPEALENKTNPFQRINSTKRIKKEIWRRRSDFLGLGSPEAISVDDLPPPPPGLEELLKSEMELQREQRLFLEKQLSLIDTEYADTTDNLNSATDSYNPVEEYISDYALEVLDSEVFDAVATDVPNESWKAEDECQIPISEVEVSEEPHAVETVEKESSKQVGSPQHKAKTHIQSLGAAPKAKIMDSNKWITQTERHISVIKQKSVEPVFREGSYNQNFWVAQEANRRTAARSHVPIDRRYSMPPAYGNCQQPNVTVRTWGDRELEYQPQQRPKSAIWQEHPSNAQSYTPPSQGSYSYPENYGSHRSSWSESVSHNIQQEQHYEIRHQCSYCGSPLTEGSAMGIDALQLYFHIECFRCCICHLQLGNGSCGTDVQVKNSQLYCPKCFLLD